MEDWAGYLAIAAFLVSVLSAIYSKRATVEAAKANRLSVHDRKLEIYRAFDSLRFAVLRMGLGITHTEVGVLYRPSRESEFYFPKIVHEKIIEYYETCFELAELNSKLEFRIQLSAEEKSQYRERQDVLSGKEHKLAEILCSELRLNLGVVV